jgi:hypothetical protein
MPRIEASAASNTLSSSQRNKPSTTLSSVSTASLEVKGWI